MSDTKRQIMKGVKKTATENGSAVFNKVQINRTYEKGINPRNGQPISLTSVMVNIRCDDVDEAVALYNDLLAKLYKKK